MSLQSIGHHSRFLVATAIVAAGISVARPSRAIAQVHVGKDSATRLLRLGRDLMYGTAEGLAFAGYDQLTNDPPEWGKGWRGYGRRAASNIGEFYIQESATEGLAALMDRPLDYTRCPCHETHSRIAWALQAFELSSLMHLASGQLPGGYKQRLAMATALLHEPEILFLDEPSAGLDPIISRNLDQLILELRDSLGATIVVVTHELPSIFTIADDAIYLDAESRTMLAQGNPKDLLQHSTDPKLRAFLTRGEVPQQAAPIAPS